MAGFHQHVGFSTALGVAYGVAGYLGISQDWATCVIAGGVTGLAGMLPDLDTPTGQPVREVMGFAAAVAPVLLADRLGAGIATLSAGAVQQDRPSNQAMIVMMAACYLTVRYGGAWLLDRLTVHRGMFHSIPAAVIVAMAAFLACSLPDRVVRGFLACGALLGFLSHLLLDELWSVRWNAGQLSLKKSSGSAFKFFSASLPANCFSYSILVGLGLLVFQGQGWKKNSDADTPGPGLEAMASELLDRLRR